MFLTAFLHVSVYLSQMVVILRQYLYNSVILHGIISRNAATLNKYNNSTFISLYEDVLISPYPDLLSHIVEGNRLCRWKEGACSCAELLVFSCYRGWKEACQATRAISTASRRELSSSFIPSNSSSSSSRISSRNSIIIIIIIIITNCNWVVTRWHSSSNSTSSISSSSSK